MCCTLGQMLFNVYLSSDFCYLVISIHINHLASIESTICGEFALKALGQWVIRLLGLQFYLSGLLHDNVVSGNEGFYIGQAFSGHF